MLDSETPARRPSPFAAAFLSFVFPGLGQLYAGAPARALAFAAVPVLGLALLAGMAFNPGSRDALKLSVFSPDMLQAILILDVLLLVYRTVAVVDAYRVAAAAAAGGSTRLGRPRVLLAPLSLAGLLGVILVMTMGHVALGRYDRIAYDTITGIAGGGGDQGGAPASAGPVPAASGVAPPAAASGLAAASPVASAQAEVTPVPWNGTDRLNVLLIGSDQRPNDGTFNTDTLIVASIDPKTGGVALFSLPRDTENTPLPPSWPASSYLGGAFPDRINNLWKYARANPNLFPFPAATAGSSALKGALGQLMGIPIKYYVMVNFGGFKQVVDTLGGATIDVQLPVADYHYPTTDGRGAIKLYIPPGIQHFSGEQALAYARARHQTSDFDRAQRQQRVITSVRQQTDVLSLLDPGRLDALSRALRSAIHTDFPAGQLPQLISLVEKANLSSLHSVVFTPPIYQQECTPAQCAVHYFIHPKVGAIQSAVNDAFSTNPALAKSRTKLASESALVWVLNGSGISGQATGLSDYLDYLGIGAVVPPVNGGRADKATYPTTVVTFYNGAEAKMPETVSVLESTLGVTIATKNDPSVSVDVIVITGKDTPKLTVPQ